MNPEVTVAFTFGDRRTGERRAIAIPISEHIVIDACQKIDWPSERADPFTAGVFCTPSQERARRTKQRQEIATFIAKIVSDFVLAEFRKRDTVMGDKRGQ